jgi:hypothetical protein
MGMCFRPFSYTTSGSSGPCSSSQRSSTAIDETLGKPAEPRYERKIVVVASTFWVATGHGGMTPWRRSAEVHIVVDISHTNCWTTIPKKLKLLKRPSTAHMCPSKHRSWALVKHQQQTRQTLLEVQHPTHKRVQAYLEVHPPYHTMLQAYLEVLLPKKYHVILEACSGLRTPIKYHVGSVAYSGL